MVKPTEPAFPRASHAAAILLVEESETCRQAMRGPLTSAGYLVLQARTGREGETIAKERRPDAVVVCDSLPDTDGPSLIRRLRTEGMLRAIPFLVVISSTRAEDELELLEAGAIASIQRGKEHELASYLGALLRSKATHPPGSRALGHSLGIKRILAVDDNMTYLRALVAELRRDSHELLLARSGEEALARLQMTTPDCILLDLNMPGLGGQETCRQIKAEPHLRDIPLLMLTASDDRASMLEGLASGADDYIAKSSDFGALRARLRAQIRRKHFEDESRRMSEELLRKEIEATEARAAAELSETRAKLLADLERKNRELERAREAAQRESQYKSRFLANMSHELRTPLNAIIGFSELLDQEIFGPLVPKQKSYVQNVLTSGLHLLTLVNDVLDLSKIEAGRMKLVREWAPVVPVIDSVLSAVEPLSRKQNVALETDVPTNLPEGYMDPVRVKQILYNLLSNGIKFTQAGGKVRLSARTRETALELVVEDTGTGIRSEDMDRLFKEFEQLEPSVGDKPEGTGLGLVLTKRLVELHGGNIGIKSEWGRGTCVTVRIPAFERDVAGAAIETKDETLVLVVEDDPKSAELLSSQLRTAGLSVAVASNADEALRLAQELRPSLITLDVMIPGIDGWGILAQLKAQGATAGIPIVIVSAVDEYSKGLMLGAADYLVKPISDEALLRTLSSLGIPLHRIAGLRILVIASEDETIEDLETHLRRAGCDVKRMESAPLAAEVALLDLVIVDAATAAPAAIARLRERTAQGGPLAVPVLTLTSTDQGGGAKARGGGATLGRMEAREPERLSRAVRTAIGSRQRESSPWDEKTGLPSATSLLVHLYSTVERATSEHKRMALVAARVVPKDPDGIAWASRLRPLLRQTDFVAMAGPDAVVLVAYGATDAEAAAIAERFRSLLSSSLELEVLAMRVVFFPEDGKRAKELLARCLVKGTARATVEEE